MVWKCDSGRSGERTKLIKFEEPKIESCFRRRTVATVSYQAPLAGGRLNRVQNGAHNLPIVWIN